MLELLQIGKGPSGKSQPDALARDCSSPTRRVEIGTIQSEARLKTYVDARIKQAAFTWQLQRAVHSQNARSL